MASMEQLQMLDDDDSSTSSSSKDEIDDDNNSNNNNNNESWSNQVEANSEKTKTPTPDLGHHKKRIKLSLGGKFKVAVTSPQQEKESTTTTDNPKSATKTNEGDSKVAPKPKSPPKPTSSTKSKSPVIQKPVTNDASKSTVKNNTKTKITVPKPKLSTVKSKPKDVKRRQSPKLPTNPAPAEVPKKRSSSSSMRSIRITPMSSPGLMLPCDRGKASDAFDQTMATAGYTVESRTQFPHRGSSVQRTVDDLFDSDVKFCVRFPALVPEEWMRTKASKLAQSSSSGPSTVKQETAPPDSASKSKVTEHPATSLMTRLKNAFQSNDKQPDSVASSSKSSAKTINRIPQFSDMIPISLSSNYPETYIQKRIEYATKVEERETAIFKMQEKQLALLASPEASTKPSVIPPIPTPPNVPTRDEIRTMTNQEDIFGPEDQQNKSHPLYLPKNKEFVKHLDERCFHAVNGRYFGLSSNAIADPYFFGPNAPGLSGLNVSASTGLAIASSGGGGGVIGSPLFMMPAQPSSSAVAANAKAASTKTISSQARDMKDKPVAKPVAKPVD